MKIADLLTSGLSTTYNCFEDMIACTQDGFSLIKKINPRFQIIYTHKAIWDCLTRIAFKINHYGDIRAPRRKTIRIPSKHIIVFLEDRFMWVL